MGLGHVAIGARSKHSPAKRYRHSIFQGFCIFQFCIEWDMRQASNPPGDKSVATGELTFRWYFRWSLSPLPIPKDLPTCRHQLWHWICFLLSQKIQWRSRATLSSMISLQKYTCSEHILDFSYPQKRKLVQHWAKQMKPAPFALIKRNGINGSLAHIVSFKTKSIIIDNSTPSKVSNMG